MREKTPRQTVCFARNGVFMSSLLKNSLQNPPKPSKSLQNWRVEGGKPIFCRKFSVQKTAKNHRKESGEIESSRSVSLFSWLNPSLHLRLHIFLPFCFGFLSPFRRRRFYHGCGMVQRKSSRRQIKGRISTLPPRVQFRLGAALMPLQHARASRINRLTSWQPNVEAT